MENQIYEVASGILNSVVLKESEIWVSKEKIKNLEKFEQAVTSASIVESSYKIKLSSIKEITYNEASEFVKISYFKVKGKIKKLSLGFGDVALSNQFGQYLGEKLNLKRASKKEGQIKPLLLNGLFVLVALGGTIFLASIDPTDLDNGESRRSRNNGAILKLVVNTVGQTGVLLIGGLITFYLLFQLYKRFKNPSNEVSYSK